MVAFVVKIFLSAITPFSLDFIGNILYSWISWQAVLSLGFYAPWFAFMRGITSLWAVLFMQHSSLENSIGYWYITPSLSVTALLMMQKAPLLIFDAATAVMIGGVVAEYRSPHVAGGAILLWLANPYVTLITEMWGTWDIVSGFFLLLAVAYFAKGRFLESGISLGLGIGLKMYPLLTLPVFLMFLTREKLGSSLRFIAGVGGAYFATGGLALILAAESQLPPYQLPTYNQLATAATLSENVSLLWGYSLVTHGIQIILVIVAGVLFVFGYLHLWKPGRTGILEAVICVYMLIFAFMHWYAQFLVNLLPLLTIFYFTSGEKKLPLIAYLSTATAFVLLDPVYIWTSWGHSFFFIPNYNPLLQHLSDILLSIRQWPIGETDVSTLITSPIRSVFAGVSVYYATWIFLRNADKRILRNILVHEHLSQ